MYNWSFHYDVCPILSYCHIVLVSAHVDIYGQYQVITSLSYSSCRCSYILFCRFKTSNGPFIWKFVFLSRWTYALVHCAIDDNLLRLIARHAVEAFVDLIKWFILFIFFVSLTELKFLCYSNSRYLQVYFLRSNWFWSYETTKEYTAEFCQRISLKIFALTCSNAFQICQKKKQLPFS